MRCRIQRYDTGTTGQTILESFLPQHVTVTGQEDHFALAYHDASQLIAGMRLLDEALKLDQDSKGEKARIIYRILAITEH